MHTRTGDSVRVHVTHVGCTECGKAVDVTGLKFHTTDSHTGAVQYFCSSECVLTVQPLPRSLMRGGLVLIQGGVSVGV